MCDRPVDARYRPFCSGRCADIDLAKWFNGSYAAPSNDPEDIEAAAEAALSAGNEPQKPH
jgi:endogenous inhibitor of DNA gyrase (YacG/DUF329 family)